MKKVISMVAVSLIVLSATTNAQPTVPIEKESTATAWNLSDIYTGWGEWEKDLKQAEQLTTQQAALKGKLGDGPKVLLAFEQGNEELGKLLTRLGCYAYLKRSLNARDQEANSKSQLLDALGEKVNTELSWAGPEFIALGEGKVKEWVAQEKGLARYQKAFFETFRQQKHVLTPEKEQLLSYFSTISGAGNAIYKEVSTSDIKFPKIALSTGDSVTLSPGKYSRIMEMSSNRADRKRAYEAMAKVYKDQENTYAAIYATVCQGHWAGARARNYNSCLNVGLEGDNIPEAVYHTLIATAKETSAPLRRYINLRKEYLGIADYANYDASISLVNATKDYSFAEAETIIRGALKPLGPEYEQYLNKALTGGWIDAYERQGKESGAYNMGVYGVHPYILLNYDGTLKYVFTFAHELGHTMHSQLSSEFQPYPTHNYSTFVAEVASKFNERLLLDYLLKTNTDPKIKVVLLEQAIKNLTRSFYNQAMFAEFELEAHKMAEQGKPINAASLNKLMGDINYAYVGDAVPSDDAIKGNWSKVMHFYQLYFYVYQYATSYAATAELYRQVTTGSEKEKKEALNRYMTLLKSGSSEYPIDLLKKAGVDMTKPDAVKAVSMELDNLVSQLEIELKKLKG